MNPIPQRSSFVTVVAWIFIIFSGFFTMMLFLQNIMLHTVFFKDPEFSRAMLDLPLDVPPSVDFLVRHVNPLYLMFFFFLIAAIVAVIVLVASIGLLKRKNWARVIFVGVMGGGILWNIGGLVVQLVMFFFITDQFADFSDTPEITAFFIAVMVVGVVLTLVFSGLFAWIAKRLMSREIRAEF